VSTLTPFSSVLPTKPLKYLAALRGEKVDGVPADGEYIGLEQIESGTGRLSEVELQQQPEGSANIFQTGDVLFGKLRPYLAKGWTADRAGYCTTEALVLQPKEADSRFVRYCILASEFIEAVNGSTYGSKMPRADWSFVGSVQVPCPDRSVQERIANFLDQQTARIDALIAEKELLAQALVEQAFSRTYDLVTRGVSSNRMEPTHVNWLRELPAHWTAPRIKHVARLESGHTPDKKVDAYWVNCDIPWVSLNDTTRLLEVDYITETTFNINKLGIENSSARILPRGTVFFSRDATIGRCGIAAREMACSQHFIGWVCGDKLLPEYLLHVLRSMTMELERVTMGATLKTIGMDDVKTLCMPLPPIDEQRLIVSAVVEHRARCFKLERHTRAFIETLREYRSSLTSAAVTGQLDLSTFNAAA
jgi:type I restriction enzyme S subunit